MPLSNDFRTPIYIPLGEKSASKAEDVRLLVGFPLVYSLEIKTVVFHLIGRLCYMLLRLVKILLIFRDTSLESHSLCLPLHIGTVIFHSDIFRILRCVAYREWFHHIWVFTILIQILFIWYMVFKLKLYLIMFWTIYWHSRCLNWSFGVPLHVGVILYLTSQLEVFKMLLGHWEHSMTHIFILLNINYSLICYWLLLISIFYWWCW